MQNSEIWFYEEWQKSFKISTLWSKQYHNKNCFSLICLTTYVACANCVDNYSQCDGWASNGFCTHSQYGTWVTTNCQKACGACGKNWFWFLNCQNLKKLFHLQGCVCENTYPNDSQCDNWASLGFCTHSYVEWMTTNCQKSCGTC